LEPRRRAKREAQGKKGRKKAENAGREVIVRTQSEEVRRVKGPDRTGQRMKKRVWQVTRGKNKDSFTGAEKRTGETDLYDSKKETSKRGSAKGK